MKTVLMVCVSGLALPAAFAFSSDNSTLARGFNKTVALTNTPVTVTVTFTNSGTNSLRGFYYTDQTPSGFAVTTLGLKVNGQNVTNFAFETGQDGDVYAGYTPCRWLLERPPNFTEANPVPPQADLQIVYSISSPLRGTFTLKDLSRAGYSPASTNASYGYSENSNQQSVSFLTTTNPASVAGQLSTNGFMLALEGEPTLNYVIETSNNLSDWNPLVTNTSPFNFTDTNAARFSLRFFRGRLLQ
jgi:hypothetical protein